MKRVSWMSSLVVAAVGLAACSGEKVVLNERIFTGDSSDLKAAGCITYELGGSAGASAGGGVGPDLLVRQDLAGDHIVVSVEESGTPLIQRTYDRSFFETTRLDEFTATSSAGTETLRLRYWGTLRDSTGCAPLTDLGPAAP